MNLVEIVDEVNRDLGEPQGYHNILSLVNRALDDLTPAAKKEVKKTTSIVDSNTYELPSDLHQIQYVTINETDYPLVEQPEVTGYRQWGNEIIIQGSPPSGTVNLYYYKKLNRLSSDSDIPEIETEYHDLLILYAKAHLIQDAKRRLEVMGQYEARKQHYITYKGKQKKRRSVNITMNW